jgi:hypothetical protein
MKHSWSDPHMIRTFRSLGRVFYITVGTFVILFAITHIAGSLYSSTLLIKQTNAFRAGIASEEAYLKLHGDQVAADPELISAISEGDRNKTLAILTAQATAHLIPRIALTDTEGTIVSRTASPGKFGDNIFLTTSVGRAASYGNSVQSIEMTSFGNQMYITTARPVLDDGHFAGVLLANHVFDDGYATHIRDEYLWPGVELVFYSKQYGVNANSFSNPDTRSIINSYFNTGSEWVANGTTGKTIDFGNGHVYVVANIIFPGLEQSSGGVLIFIPRVDLSAEVNMLTSILTLIVFVFMALRMHFAAKSEERGWRYYLLLAVVCVPVFSLTVFALQAYSIGRIHLGRVPYALYNSTMRLQPAFGIYSIGFQQRFSVVVDTGDEPVNAVQIRLNYNPKLVSFDALDTASSSCSYIIENTIDQNAGTADLSCIILDSAAGQQSLTIGDALVTPKSVGSFSLSFDPKNTHVLANDGLGTDVLRMTQDSSYSADTFSSALFGGSTSATTTGRQFVVFSTTHPNQSQWYNSRDAKFVWLGKPGAIYRYAFDSASDTVPTNEYTTQQTQLDIPVPGDGIYYLHLQLASGGPIAHYRVRSDMTAPRIVRLASSKSDITAGDVVRFSFEAEDAQSGVQRNFYINLGDHLFLPVGSQLYVPFLEAGDQSVTLRVYDSAGNYSEKTETIHVQSK